jgi:MoxR-like ATPase
MTGFVAHGSATVRGANDGAQLERLVGALNKAHAEIGKVVLGQEDVVRQLLVGLVSDGHTLLEGPPGVGKTMLIRTLSSAVGLDFNRIQFTPDLMPADITGGNVLAADDTGAMRLQFQPGPVFTQLLLADEINRATPRTQSALLEAMQERTISVAGTSKPLPAPFFVLATQNPIEMDGTYALPEAQIDRFMLRIDVGYPSEATLATILQGAGGVGAEVEQILTPDDVLDLQALVRAVPVAEHVRQAVARFALSTQSSTGAAANEAKRYVRFGLSPRGAQALMNAARGHALISGKFNVGFDDLRAMLASATRHRIQLNFEGQADGVDRDGLVRDLFERAVSQAK